MPSAPLSYTFAQLLTQSQTKTYHLHTFEVPNGATALDIDLSYAPKRVGALDNRLTIALFDTRGFRGEAHRGASQQSIQLAGPTATPGFIPGRLPPGEWTVQVAAHAVVESTPALQYQVQVRVHHDADESAPVAWKAAQPRTLALRPGWYRGEMHTHTIHSDGGWTLAQMWQRAQELGLDFLFLTDHNTISGLNEIADLPASRPLVIPGMEVTSFRGHALCLGVSRWIDWRTGINGRTSSDFIADVHAAGGIVAIAHPFTVGDPMCTGCNWEYPFPQPGPAKDIEAVEICNETWRVTVNDNPMNLALWRRLLTPGGGPTAISGADAHSRRGWPPEAIFNWVYATELSAAGVLDGIRKGHVVVSSGPSLQLSAQTDGAGQWAIPGSRLVAARLTVRASWSGAPAGAMLRLLRGKETIRSDAQETGELTVEEAATPTWYSAEIWDGDTLLALTNPIYVTPGQVT